MPGRAEAALDGAHLQEALLQRVKSVFEGQTLYGGHLAALDLAGGYQAGVDRPVIQQDRAGPALPHAAAFLDPEQSQMIPQNGQQGFTSGAFNGYRLVVQNKVKFHEPGL